MKKIFFTIAIAGISITSLNSCNTYRSFNNATSISQLAGNPFMQNIAKGLVSNMGSMLLKNGISNIGKLGLNTNLSSLLTNATLVDAFKGMLSNNYGVGSSIIENGFSKLGTIKDVVGFLGSNATKGIGSW